MHDIRVDSLSLDLLQSYRNSVVILQILNGSQNGVRRLLKPGMQRPDSRDSADMEVPSSDRPSEVEPAAEEQEAMESSMDSGHLAPIGAQSLGSASTEIQV